MSMQGALRVGVVPALLASLAVPAAALRPPLQQPEAIEASSPEQAPKPEDGQILDPGKPIEREFSAGQTHAYRIHLEAGQLLVAVVEEKGIPVTVSTFAPDGTKLRWDYSFFGLEGPTTRVVAETAGIYRLVVKPDVGATTGHYVIHVDQVRAATPAERQRDVAWRLMFKADVLRRSGKFAEGIEVGERALAICDGLLGPEHLDVEYLLEILGYLHGVQGDLDKAEATLQRSLTLAEKLHGPESALAAELLSRLASVHMNRSEWAKSLPVLHRALLLSEKIRGVDYLGTAYIVNNLAVAYKALGDYVKAEPLYRRALEIGEKLGPESEHTGLFLINLGQYYKDTGDLAKAEPILRRAIAIDEKILGKDHPFVATDLANLSGLLTAKGEYSEAESLGLRGLAIREKAFGPDHPAVASSLNNLGYVYNLNGEPLKAQPIIERARAIYEQKSGPDAPALAPVLLNLAVAYFDAGRFEDALPLVERALAINRRVFGEHNNETVKDLSWLSNLSWVLGDVVRAIDVRSQHNEAREWMSAVNLVVGSERQKLAYLTTSPAGLYETISLHTLAAPANSTALRLAIEVVLRRKGRTLDAMSDAIGSLRRRALPQDRTALDELAHACAVLSARTLAGPGRQDSARYQADLRALQEQVDTLESAIATRSAQFRAQSAPITLAAVQKAVPAGAALVEFAWYRAFDPRAKRAERVVGVPRYVAYVIVADGEPRWVDLGEAARIDDAVAALRSALRDPKRSDVRVLSRSLDEMVMRPVRGLLGAEVRQLLVSPDGALNLVPFQALEDEKDGFLVERYAVSYLTSGRDLLRLREHVASRQAPLILANPDFAGGNGEVAAVRGTSMEEVRFRALPGSLGEARSIERLLPGARLLTGPGATEAALGEVAGPEVLHLATHGFFIESDDGADDRSVDVRPPEGLLRSGIALAGANRKESAATKDGIVTALEFANLDLWGTRLVVISACDTGLGDVRASDGVYGLRRAMVLAGSETQMMSLWDVDDRATRELMVAYYKELIGGAGRAEAMRRVQLKMLKDPRHRHPAYWAGFIVSGDWRPLNPREATK